MMRFLSTATLYVLYNSRLSVCVCIAGITPGLTATLTRCKTVLVHQGERGYRVNKLTEL